LNPGAHLDGAAILERVQSNLGGLKTPKLVEIWDEIPKTAVGKIDKKAIRARYWSDADRAVN
jgi:fatty-acyl-CoA synthase